MKRCTRPSSSLQHAYARSRNELPVIWNSCAKGNYSATPSGFS